MYQVHIKKVKKINNLKNKLKSYNEGHISFEDIKKSLEEVLNKNEPILYILNQLQICLFGERMI